MEAGALVRLRGLPDELRRAVLDFVAFCPATSVELRDAVRAWARDRGAAERRFGHISLWMVHRVTDMSDLFKGCESFNDDIGAWDTSGVTSMSSMFSSARAFDQDTGGWDTSSVTDMRGIFMLAAAFNQDLCGWDVRRVGDGSHAFSVSGMAGAANCARWPRWRRSDWGF